MVGERGMVGRERERGMIGERGMVGREGGGEGGEEWREGREGKDNEFVVSLV